MLDTNAAIAIIENDPAMQIWLDNDYETFVSSIVIGELYFGAYKSSRREANLTRLETFLAGNTVISADSTTGKWYGQIKTSLR